MKNSYKNIILTFLSKGAAFFLNMSLAKNLELHEYADYNLYVMSMTYGALYTLGLSNGFTIVFPYYTNIRSFRLKYNQLTYSFIVSTFLFFFVFLVALYFIQEIYLALVLSLLVLFRKIVEILIFYHQSLLDFEVSYTIRFVAQALPPLVSIFLVLNKASFFSVFFVELLFLFIITGYYFFKLQLLEVFRITKWKYLKLLNKKYYSIGFPIFISVVIGLFMRDADRLFLVNFWSKDKFAIYVFCLSISSIIYLFVVSFSMPKSQVLIKKIKSKESNRMDVLNARNRLIKECFLLAFILFPISIVGYYLTTNLFVTNYAGHLGLFSLIALSMVLLSIMHPYFYYIQGMGYGGALVKYNLVCLIIILLLNSLIVYFEQSYILLVLATNVVYLLFFIYVRKLSNLV